MPDSVGMVGMGAEKRDVVRKYRGIQINERELDFLSLFCTVAFTHLVCVCVFGSCIAYQLLYIGAFAEGVWVGNMVEFHFLSFAFGASSRGFVLA